MRPGGRERDADPTGLAPPCRLALAWGPQGARHPGGAAKDDAGLLCLAGGPGQKALHRRWQVVRREAARAPSEQAERPAQAPRIASRVSPVITSASARMRAVGRLSITAER